ncbi:hypothetical protein [Pseudoalteromonas ulvae]|uniref:hypothetical protein n=1 Tax=Pseudoalteromonas ulvae TaxID=107327 RepID=UPI00186BA6C3|nr:hypothetical protein [Pseudoalteromonas ulvae]
MAFYKYLSTHEGVHIDFKLEKLSRIFGLLRRDKNESRCREYIVDKLGKLIILKFIRCYGWDAETNIYRILQSKHFSQNEAEFALKHQKSNLKFQKGNK